ncbi:aspartate ammonia-lyase [Candidatus Micrarchaeota archaeon]|nr:aspartate ammonia-lyase [Candidatus Micrarchaeota archaeon]
MKERKSEKGSKRAGSSNNQNYNPGTFFNPISSKPFMRTESDFLGPVQVPDNAYYGGFTVRAAKNFQLSAHKAPPQLIRAILLIKKASALANRDEGLLEPIKANAILQAADEALAGKFDDQFILDAFQAGAGTPYNMNVNEVLANRATELLGGRKGQYLVHPNNHVNMSQSSNDVIPTATKLACLLGMTELERALIALESAFQKKAHQFAKIVKPARTHLQDAVPMTLGQQFRSYASAIIRSHNRIRAASDALKEIHLGGTAAGTGINTTPTYRASVAKHLSKLCGMPLQPTDDPIELTQNHNDFLHFGQSLSLVSTDLCRICTNLKLLSSGPKAGLAEIILPDVEPGSSIMPGKVNPSVPEAAEMAAMHVMGAMHSVELCCLNAQLDLNTNTPLVAFELLNGMDLLTNTATMLGRDCIGGIRANPKQIQHYVDQSTIVATALNPVLGYSAVSKLVQESVRTGKPVRQLVQERKLLPQKELDRLLDAESLTKPNLKTKKQGKGLVL